MKTQLTPTGRLSKTMVPRNYCRGLALMAAALFASHPALAQRTQRPASSLQGRGSAAPAAGVAESSAPTTSWTAGAVYPSTIVRYAFAQNGNDLYIISGVSAGAPVTSANRYNAVTNAWTALAPIPAASEAPASALFNGKIYVASGFGPASSLSIYDIAGNTWTTGAARPTPDSYGAAAGAFNGNVYVVGGGDINGTGTTTTSIYNIAGNTWSAGPVAPSAYELGGYRQIGQYLYCIGSFTGTAGVNTTVSMRLDMSTNTWSTGPAWTPGRADTALAAAGNRLFAIGGDANGGGFFDGSTQVDELDTTTWPSGSWVASPDNLPTARQANQAGFFSTGRAGGEIWSTGGVTPEAVFLNEHLFRSQAVVSCQYNATTSMGNVIVPGTTDIGNHCDDCTTAINFPFPVTLYGTTFTTAMASSNGSIQFTGNSATYFGTNCPLPDPNLGTAIMPYQGDLRTDQTGNGIFTSVSGTAPTRIFNMEWRASYFDNTSTANFEVRFFESTGDFAVIYGATTDNGAQEESGVQEGPMGRATAFSCNEANLPAGLKVAYRCPGAACSDYTVTPSRRPLIGAPIDIGNHCDDCTTAINLPFPVSLYGTSFTTGFVSSNGNLQFASNNAANINTVLPAAAFSSTIFPFWEDLRTDQTGNGIFSLVGGTAPNRTFALEYRTSLFGATSNTTGFEILFTEGSTGFEVLYGATVGSGFTGTIGAQQSPSGLSTQVAGPSAAVPAANTRYIFTLGCCPPLAFTGALGTNSSGYPGVSGMQTGRVIRNGIPSSCGTTKPYPGTNDTTLRAYDAYTFVNNGPATCATFSVNAACASQIFPVVYLGSFDPANIATNYLADVGSSPVPFGNFSVNVPANATVVLVVSEVTPGAGCSSYDVVASGLNCVPLALTSAASRKTHGAAGTFDIPLPLTGSPGVECRGTGGNYTLVFNFNNLIASGHAVVTSGVGTAGVATVSGQRMIVPLAGVTDIQQVTVTMNTVESLSGEVLPNTAVSMNILVGDVTGNKTVNASDVGTTKANSGTTVGATNFRSDINANGSINASDVGQVKANSGHIVP